MFDLKGMSTSKGLEGERRWEDPSDVWPEGNVHLLHLPGVVFIKHLGLLWSKMVGPVSNFSCNKTQSSLWEQNVYLSKIFDLYSTLIKHLYSPLKAKSLTCKVHLSSIFAVHWRQNLWPVKYTYQASLQSIEGKEVINVRKKSYNYLLKSTSCVSHFISTSVPYGTLLEPNSTVWF